MTLKHKVVIPVEVTIYEPEETETGQSIPMFLMMGGSNYTFRDKEYGVGDAMGAVAAYLPNDRGATLSYADFVGAVLNALGIREA